MEKKLLWIMVFSLIISCSTDSTDSTENSEDNPSSELELKPEIEISINPNVEPVPYNSEVTINWTITNTTSAQLDGEEIDLIGSKIFEDLIEDTRFKITAINIHKSDSLIETITVKEEPTSSLSSDIIFTKTHKYFSTDGSMEEPVSKETAISLGIVDKIDISYSFEQNDDTPGFMDPITRSIEISAFDNYHQPWLSEAVETIFYSSSLGKEDFELAKNDETKIDEYFTDQRFTISTSKFYIPDGSFIGNTFSHFRLREGMVIGFENKESGKKGMIYISTNQQYAWPFSALGFDTRVQIIREN